MKKIAVPVIAALVLAGCLSEEKKITEINCGDEMTKSTLRDLVQESLEDQVKKELQSGVNGQPLSWDAAKFRALVSLLNIDFVHVRTTKKDPNSTKRFCEAEMKVIIPVDVAEAADKVRKSLGYPNIVTYAAALDVKYEAGAAFGDIEYSAQPTDDGNTVYVSTAKKNKSVDLVTEVIAANLVKPLIEAAEAKKVKEQADEQARLAKIAQERQELEKEQDRLRLEKAQSGIKEANDQINVVWNGATSDFRKTALPEQRIWLKERDLECREKANAVGEGASETDREVVRLNCETEMTVARTSLLKAKVASHGASVSTKTDQQ
ncbi:hypothetical protein [Zoogloea sp.]|uniref:hypothetical protein n=1 Tax=Zoogloea sp. TaxID=49181 RepID=UPI0035B22927